VPANKTTGSHVPNRFYYFVNENYRDVDTAAVQEWLLFWVAVAIGVAIILGSLLSIYYHSLSAADRIILAFVSGQWQDGWMISRALGWPS
jgi:hypothetical protein